VHQCTCSDVQMVHDKQGGGSCVLTGSFLTNVSCGMRSLADSGQMFDRVRPSEDPLQFSLGGASGIVRGWELAVPTMTRGEHCLLRVRGKTATAPLPACWSVSGYHRVSCEVGVSGVL
jgi:FKBP-type peptidyl-prolyl cis-trans isomerase